MIPEPWGASSQNQNRIATVMLSLNEDRRAEKRVQAKKKGAFHIF
jgi:hypothetical protein